MNTAKKYRDSLLSILCVVSWFVLVFRILKSAQGDSVVTDFIVTYFVTTGVGIVGGIILLFLGIVRKGKVKYSFVYNLLGTLNLIIGLLGLAQFSSGVNPSPYIATACFGVGVVMYKDIYYRKMPQAVQGPGN
jgi:hypothetical protein